MDLSNYKLPEVKKGIKDPRTLVFSDIADRVLGETTLKKITPATLGKYLKRYNTQKLYELHSTCSKAKSYPAMFWYLVRRPVDNPLPPKQ